MLNKKLLAQGILNIRLNHIFILVEKDRNETRKEIKYIKCHDFLF